MVVEEAAIDREAGGREADSHEFGGCEPVCGEMRGVVDCGPVDGEAVCDEMARYLRCVLRVAAAF